VLNYKKCQPVNFFYHLLLQWYYFILIKKFKTQNQILEAANQRWVLNHQGNPIIILHHWFYA